MPCGQAFGKEASNTPSREFSGLFNGLLTVVCYLVLSHVPSVHDFDSTPRSICQKSSFDRIDCNVCR
jgi:hypothetical protein